MVTSRIFEPSESSTVRAHVSVLKSSHALTFPFFRVLALTSVAVNVGDKWPLRK